MGRYYRQIFKFGGERINRIIKETGLDGEGERYASKVKLIESYLENYDGPIYNEETNTIYTRSIIRYIKKQIREENEKIAEKVREEARSEGYKEVTDVLSKIANNESVIEINLEGLNNESKEYVESMLPEIIKKLADNISLKNKWKIELYFKNKAPQYLTMNENVLADLYNKLFNGNGIQNLELDAATINEINYDKIPENISNITKLVFKDGRKYQRVTSKGFVADDKVLQNSSGKKSYETAEGGFWKYYSNIPVDLTKYQIVNDIHDEKSVKLISKDNCLVYSLKQYGISNDKIEAVKSILTTRTFAMSKLEVVANIIETNIKVTKYFLDDNNSNTFKYPKRSSFKETVELVLMDGHYMLNDPVPISKYYVSNYERLRNYREKYTEEQLQHVVKINNKGSLSFDYDKTTKLTTFLLEMFNSKRFNEITLGDILSYKYLNSFNLLSYDDLEYEEKCVRSIAAQQNLKERQEVKLFNNVYYADYEASTDGDHHKAYMVCVMNKEGDFYRMYWGEYCSISFLDCLKDNSLVYFHNLSYDITFFIRYLKVLGEPIIKGGRTMQIKTLYKGNTITFKDSLAMISHPLRMFPGMFKLASGDKEVFPYNYYNSERLKGSCIGNVYEAAEYTNDAEHFIDNIVKRNVNNCYLGDGKFDMIRYSEYYCKQDVDILRQGFEKFRNDTLESFNLDAYYNVSSSSIANLYMIHNVYSKNEKLNELGGKPRDFISRCVQGGRCMTKDNAKQFFDGISGGKMENGIFKPTRTISDFDAVSLYPSAIHRLYCLEGAPKVLTKEMCSTEYLLKHLFKDNQFKPTNDRFISGFFVEVEITRIGKPKHMPLIVVNPKFNPGINAPRSSNTCCTMFIDHITFEDLITFQDCDMKVVRGYYFNEGRDITIRKEIEKLFNLRLKYKKEGNPLQNTIKIILNSVYGKCLLKPINNKYTIMGEEEASKYINKNYNSIEKIETMYGSDNLIIKSVKGINNHFNFVTLGVNILSMSKRIMNEVFCTAEENNINIFYQDTDSGHYFTDELDKLAQIYEEKYGRTLRGSALGQFHSDFAEVVKGKESRAIKSIFVGKKTYIDMLQADETNSIGFHIRMKGVPQDVITKKANSMFPNAVQCYYDNDKGLHLPIGSYDINSKFSVMLLYEAFYNGDEISFDLCDGSGPCFDRKSNFSFATKSHFIRRLKF